MVSISWLSFSHSIVAQKADSDCINCFTTEVISVDQEENCLHVELKVNANQCGKALSHYTIEIPCGTIAEASNSEQWPMQLNSTDPTTNIYGLKVDDIKEFGEDGQPGSFTIKYTVCSDDEDCRKALMHQAFTVAYKAGTCIFTDSITLFENTLGAQIIPTPITCHGDNMGSIDVSVSNGTPPYTYLWNNGETSEDLNNLLAGNYSVTITDANSETLTLETVLTEPEPIQVNATLEHAHCGLSDGAIQIVPSGGAEPYTYLWNTGDTITSLNQLDGGNYSVTITDALACSESFSYNIINQTDLRATVSTSVIECYEEGTGSLTVEAKGGTAPYTYQWANGDTDSTTANLNSGSHKVTITDANGCSITKNGYVIIKKLKVSNSVVEPICNNDNSGSISLNISEGTEPYTIKWNTGETTSTIENLSAGWYWADITDSMGCTEREYVKVSEPNQISLSTSIKRQSCQENDSVILVSVSGAGGTPPYQIYYKDQLINGEVAIEKEGYHDFTAIDANGCTVTESVNIKRPETGLDIALSILQPNCEQNNGSAEITIESGIAPYAIQWSDGNTALTRNDLQAGNYQVTVEDANGCSTSQELIINQVIHPSVNLISPDTPPGCNTPDNLIVAMVENADDYFWSLHDSSGSWSIQTEQMEQLLYTAGDGSATVSLEVSSSDGCTAMDTIAIACSNTNDSGGGDGDGDNTTPPSNCDNTCFDILPVEWRQSNDECYTYKARVTTDGSCKYDLSHLTLHVENGYVNTISNSENWAIERNSTDPTTGLHGLKIDDISGFGKQNDAFDIEFSVCYNDGKAQSTFMVAYKAAQCVMLDTLIFEAPQQELSAQSYPNPFTDRAIIEFTPSDDAYAIVNIYGINGELIECLHKGNVEAGSKYTFDFNGQSNGNNIYFYRISCGDQSTYGKIIQTKH